MAATRIQVDQNKFDLHEGEAGTKPYDTTITRHFCGTVYTPHITDNSYVPSLIKYHTAYHHQGWMVNNSIHAVCNIISSQLVLLTDNGRFQPQGTQINAVLSAQADSVAYWTFPYPQSLRLSIQYLDDKPLRSATSTLPAALDNRRIESEGWFTYVAH